MGRRKRVKEDTKMKKNKNGNAKGETSISTSSSSTKRTREQNKSTNSKIEGRENSSKKMKRGESSNSVLGNEAGAGQSQESSVKETTINELPPENANGEPSTSSLYWTRSRKEAQVPEIRELELSSKRKKDTADSSNSPDQDEAADEGPINDLPPEMLTKILKYVDPSTLFDCRLVSRKWCEISSEILTARTDIMPSFKDYDTKWVRMDSGRSKMEKYKGTRLQEFVNSMKQSNHCPYASYFFNVDDPSFFDDEDWIEFLSLFAPSNPNQIQNQRTKIRRLYLKCDVIHSTKRLRLFTEKLRDILMIKIPHLQELDLGFPLYKDGFKNVKLFPLPKTPEPESAIKTAVSLASVPAQVQLPYLKVLEIEPDMFLNLPGIVGDLLKAAVNLNELQVKPLRWDDEYCNSQVFQFLYSLGKLHLLKNVEIDVDAEFLSDMKNSTLPSDFPLAFKLYKLKLHDIASINTPDFYADATIFISNLLESSKETMEKLEMSPLGFLNELQFPQFTKLKTLKLKCDVIDNTEALPLFMEKLRDVLVYKIPHLQELGLEFASDIEDYKNFKLFPKPPEPESAIKTAVSLASVPAQVQLPYLKVLEIEPDMFLNLPGIVEDLLNAAVNLTKIQLDPAGWGTEHCNSQVFQFLYSLGKLHLLKKVEINVDSEFLSDMKNSTLPSDFPLAFKLYKLKLHDIASINTPDFYADATNFISNLLESSKETMEKLEIPRLGFLNELQFPKFTKLKTLKLDAWDAEPNERQQQLFPPGIRSRSREIFSTVANLKITTKDWQRAFPQEDSIPIFSSVHTFCFSDKEWVKKNVIAKLALMCPNLKHCTIETLEGNSEQFNFPRLGRDIWTHLKQLESLEVDVGVNLQNHAFPAFDSCFTGISRENCQRLSDLMKAEKTRYKSKSQVKLPESEELTMLTQRKHPSILDMKSLKKLTINPYSGRKKYQGEKFWTTKITWISEEFAFKLMPHLEFNGRRPSTTS